MATAIEPTTTGNPAVDLAALRARVAQLETESAGIEVLIDEAARAADEALVTQQIALQRILPHRLREARADVLRAEIALAEVPLPALDAAKDAAIAESDRLRAAAVEAQAAARLAEEAWQSFGRERHAAVTNRDEAHRRVRELRAALAATLEDRPVALPTPLRPVAPARAVPDPHFVYLGEPATGHTAHVDARDAPSYRVGRPAIGPHRALAPGEPVEVGAHRMLGGLEVVGDGDPDNPPIDAGSIREFPRRIGTDGLPA